MEKNKSAFANSEEFVESKSDSEGESSIPGARFDTHLERVEENEESSALVSSDVNNPIKQYILDNINLTFMPILAVATPAVIGITFYLSQKSVFFATCGFLSLIPNAYIAYSMSHGAQEFESSRARSYYSILNVISIISKMSFWGVAYSQEDNNLFITGAAIDVFSCYLVGLEYYTNAQERDRGVMDMLLLFEMASCMRPLLAQYINKPSNLINDILDITSRIWNVVDEKAQMRMG